MGKKRKERTPKQRTFKNSKGEKEIYKYWGSYGSKDWAKRAAKRTRSKEQQKIHNTEGKARVIKSKKRFVTQYFVYNR